jgi:hypothetical protein
MPYEMQTWPGKKVQYFGKQTANFACFWPVPKNLVTTTPEAPRKTNV